MIYCEFSWTHFVRLSLVHRSFHLVLPPFYYVPLMRVQFLGVQCVCHHFSREKRNCIRKEKGGQLVFTNASNSNIWAGTFITIIFISIVKLLFKHGWKWHKGLFKYENFCDKLYLELLPVKNQTFKRRGEKRKVTTLCINSSHDASRNINQPSFQKVHKYYKLTLYNNNNS